MSIFSVSEVTKYIKRLMDKDASLSKVYVRGEISNFKRHYSGHCYFTLKDSDATLKAVMFRSRAQYLKFEPKDGLKVIAGGNITVFERDGQYQLYVEQLVPEGFGELNLAFAQLKDKLSAEGLFDQARKLPLPQLPRAVGIITSPAGAALRDIVTVAKRRHPGIALILYPVQVQGIEAAGQIAQAIEVFNTLGTVDVIIVGRGGGSLEELWAFNEEKTVRAVAASAIPIVSAVGHETDYTLTDFAADKRAATPSQAAELVVPDVRELQRYIIALQDMLENYMRRMVDNYRLRVEHLRSSRAFTRPEDMLYAKQQQLDNYSQRLQQALKHMLVNKQHRFKVSAEKLSMLNPLAVVARGYSITQTKDGKIVSRAAEVAPGQRLEVLLHQGTLEVEVIKVKETAGDEG